MAATHLACQGPPNVLTSAVVWFVCKHNPISMPSCPSYRQAEAPGRACDRKLFKAKPYTIIHWFWPQATFWSADQLFSAYPYLYDADCLFTTQESRNNSAYSQEEHMYARSAIFGCVCCPFHLFCWCTMLELPCVRDALPSHAPTLCTCNTQCTHRAVACGTHMHMLHSSYKYMEKVLELCLCCSGVRHVPCPSNAMHATHEQ